MDYADRFLNGITKILNIATIGESIILLIARQL